MCITLHAAELTGTKIYAGEAVVDEKYVHVLAYSNKADSARRKIDYADEKTARQKLAKFLAFNGGLQPNAMVLPIPAVSLGQDNILDTRKYKGFLDNIIEGAKRPNRSRSMTKGVLLGADSFDRAEVFDVGSFTIVVSSSAKAIQEALVRVPVEKRPALNQEVVEGLEKLYPNWPIVVACWSGAIEAEPLLMWYEPLNPSTIYAPAVDAHDGQAPQQTSVRVDHFVAFGSTIYPAKEAYFSDVNYSTSPLPDHVRQILPLKGRSRPRLPGRSQVRHQHSSKI